MVRSEGVSGNVCGGVVCVFRLLWRIGVWMGGKVGVMGV